MTPVLRIVLGLALVVAALVTRSKVATAGDGAELTVYGIGMAPAVLWAILALAALAGGLMFAVGVKGLLAGRK